MALLYVQTGYVAAGYVYGQTWTLQALIFALGADSVQFSRRPHRPQRSLSFVQPDVRSSGAERIGWDYTVKDDLIDLRWPAMARTERDNLITFWRTKARGMANPFTFTDATGAVLTVRFASPKLDRIRERAYDSYEVNLQLRIQ